MVDIELELPEGFLEEEVRDGIKVSKELKEIWAIELDMTKKLLDVCKKHNLKIYGCGGTTLGAVRHKGYIPWDDDIDFMMFRDDYEKLEEIAKEEFKYPYFYQTEYTDPGTLRGHSQIRRTDTTGILKWEKSLDLGINQGIFVDIFPLDCVADNEKDDLKYGKRAKRYLKIAKVIASFTTRFNAQETGIKGVIRRIIRFLFGKIIIDCKIEEKFYRKFEETCMHFNNDYSERVALLSFDYFIPRERRYREDFDETIYEKFEMLTIPIAKGYDRALRMLYGDDYMTPIPGGDCHGGVIFDTNNSYLDYIHGEK